MDIELYLRKFFFYIILGTSFYKMLKPEMIDQKISTKSINYQYYSLPLLFLLNYLISYSG